MTQIRLNKYIADCGVASRRKAEELIIQGRVAINENIILELSSKVDPEKDIVTIDGEKISQKRHVYILLNKPRGVVTTTSDEKNRKTVLDVIKSKEKVFPVGRLDYNTTGVLLLTNDGDFSYLLTHPSNNVPREYEVKLDKPLSDDDKQSLLKGVYIEGKKGKFTSVSFPYKKDKYYVNVVSVEGRNHFVKNMFSTLNYTVTSLNRKSFAGIVADIPVGSYRNMTQTEINGVLKRYGS